MAQQILFGYQLQKDVALQVRRTIYTVLEWTRDEYAVFMYEQGVAYVRWWLPVDEEKAQKALAHKAYWNWWRNQWDMRDEEWLRRATPEASLSWEAYTPEELRGVYSIIHNPRRIVLERTPSEVLTQFILKA